MSGSQQQAQVNAQQQQQQATSKRQKAPLTQLVQSLIKKKASEAVARIAEAKAQVEQEITAKGLTLSKEATERIVENIVRTSFDEERKPKPQPQLSSFTKFEGKQSPEAFLATFEAELNLHGLTDDEDRMQWLPELLAGPTKWFAATLRLYGSWGAMSRKFEVQFSVDENVVFTDLESLRCQGFEIVKYTEEITPKQQC